MNELVITEYKGVRVLTTQQLAEEYETDSRVISNNFNRNKDRYTEGKHFICLTGDEKREFLNRPQVDDSSKNASIIYLWTKKGAFLHAKSLSTDKAWEVYDRLVDFYFDKQKPLTQIEIIEQSIKIITEHDKKINAMDSRMDKLEYEIPLYGSEADELSNHVKRKGVAVLGGKNTVAYKDTNVRSKVYRDIYDQLKREFGLYGADGRAVSYKALKRKYIYGAHECVDSYEAPTYIRELIEDTNAQVTFKTVV